MIATKPFLKLPTRLSLKATLKVDAGDYSSLATLLVSSGIAIRRFAEEEINLESAFMAFTKGAGAKI